MSSKEEKAKELAIQLHNQGKLPTTTPLFEESHKKEILGLLQHKVFEIIDKSEATGRIFNTQFVDDIKYNNNSPYEKSRLVVQAFKDIEKTQILT